MGIADALIGELEQEAATTRRVLERVPADKLTWKPHDKSMSLGQLAMHVASIPPMIGPGSVRWGWTWGLGMAVGGLAMQARPDDLGQPRRVHRLQRGHRDRLAV